MNNRDGWQNNCEEIEHTSDNVAIKFDEVKVVEERQTTYLLIEGVRVSEKNESDKDTSFYGLPNDPDVAADIVVQEFTE